MSPAIDVPKRSSSLKLRIVSWNMHESLPKVRFPRELWGRMVFINPFLTGRMLG